VRRIAQALA